MPSSVGRVQLQHGQMGILKHFLYFLFDIQLHFLCSHLTYCALKKANTYRNLYSGAAIVCWAACHVNIGTNKTGFLQGNKLDNVNSRTTSIKLILRSHFMSKTLGGPDTGQQQYVLKLFFLFGNFCFISEKSLTCMSKTV